MKGCDYNRAASRQRGFTLIEIMATLAVLAILLGLAVSSYRSLQERNQVWAAAEALGSMMQAARVRALSTGSSQYVTVDIANDTITSTFSGGAYNSGTQHVTGGETAWTGVDWIDSLADGSAPASPVTTQKTFVFTSRGTGSSQSIKVQGTSGVSSEQVVITVAGATGRISYTEL